MPDAENDPCVCDPNGPCLGVPGDTIGCDACLVLDPEEACIHDCDGSSECIATLHVHGCFADRDGARCDDPGDHAAHVIPPAGCDNYRPPLTCLTAPSSEAGRCDKCRTRVTSPAKP